MPQPVSRVLPGAGITITNASAGEAFRRHPELAALAAEAIATWANVEYAMLDLFIDLAGGVKEKASAIYLSLAIQSAKAAAINAVISYCTAEHIALFNAINGVIKSRQKERDKLAHWLWGYSDYISDALLLGNPNDYIRILEPFRDYSFTGPELNSMYADLSTKTLVYRKTDFLGIVAENRKLVEYLQKLKYIVSFPPLDADNSVYDSLLSEPAIADRVRRQASRDQTPPEGTE
jgi:hypothetical protein